MDKLGLLLHLNVGISFFLMYFTTSVWTRKINLYQKYKKNGMGLKAHINWHNYLRNNKNFNSTRTPLPYIDFLVILNNCFFFEHPSTAHMSNLNCWYNQIKQHVTLLDFKLPFIIHYFHYICKLLLLPKTTLSIVAHRVVTHKTSVISGNYVQLVHKLTDGRLKLCYNVQQIYLQRFQALMK